MKNAIVFFFFYIFQVLLKKVWQVYIVYTNYLKLVSLVYQQWMWMIQSQKQSLTISTVAVSQLLIGEGHKFLLNKLL